MEEGGPEPEGLKDGSSFGSLNWVTRRCGGNEIPRRGAFTEQHSRRRTCRCPREFGGRGPHIGSWDDHSGAARKECRLSNLSRAVWESVMEDSPFFSQPGRGERRVVRVWF